MMKSSRLEKDSKNRWKDNWYVRNLFRLKKEIDNTTIKENEAIKDRVIRNIRNLFGQKEEENYYKPVRVDNFWATIITEYESNGDRNKTLLL